MLFEMLRVVIVAISCCLAICVSGSQCISQEPKSGGDNLSASDINAITRSVIETVLEKHIQPPARQQMVLEVLREIASEFGQPALPNLSLNVSDAKGIDEVYDFLATELQKHGLAKVTSAFVFRCIASALDRVVPGGLEFESKTTVLAEEQIAANRYVGIGVALSSMAEGKGQKFITIFSDGPASEAGILANDFLEAIDDKSTKDSSLADTIQCLRGPADSAVTLLVRTEGESPRTLTLVRRIVPIQSAKLHGSSLSIGAVMIQIDRVAASTPNEIQSLVSKWEKGAKAVSILVLDVRNTLVDNLHYLHLFADAILDAGTLGQVQSRTGVRTLKTEEGTLLGDKRIVVLYSPGHSEPLDMLAEASSAAGVPVFYTPQSLNPAMQIQMASGQPIRESVPVHGTDYFVQICTTRLLDANGAVISNAGKRNDRDGLSKGGHPQELMGVSSTESELSMILNGLK